MGLTKAQQKAEQEQILKELGGGTTTSGSGSSSNLTLPSWQKLVAVGLPKSVAKLVAGEKIPVTAGSDGLDGEELLSAIDSITPQTFDPAIAKAITAGEAHLISQALSGYLGISTSGSEEQRTDEADNSAHFIPTSGLLDTIPTNTLSTENFDNLQTRAENAEEAEALKVDTATIQADENAPSLANESAYTGATVSAKYSAEASADSDLTDWGLDTPEMDKKVAEWAASGMTNVNEILQNIRATKTYKDAFPGLAEYNSKPGQIHMTESEYRTYSQALQSSAQQYGGVKLNQQQVSQLLNGNVSASEFQQRVQDIGVAVANSDQTTKNLLQEQYGISPNHLFAYYANPKESLPDMQRAVASGEIQDYASRVGLAGLTPAGAGQLADMAKLSATQGNNPLGVGVSNIEGSLLTASRDTALLKSNPGQGTPSVNTNTLIGSQLAGFGGTNQEAAQIEVGRAESSRAAPFDRGGGYSETSRGVEGIGSAST